MSQSWVPISTILKMAPKLLEEPQYAKNVAMIQVDRFLRNLSLRPENGIANRIRQCSVRITDICNLRCHTCGQWGDQGFLRGCSIPDLKREKYRRIVISNSFVTSRSRGTFLRFTSGAENRCCTRDR